MMRTTARSILVGGIVAAALFAPAAPAAAKGAIAEASISGPGLRGGFSSLGGGGGMQIEDPAADTMWELSGASWMRKREDSVSELGLAPADLGPRYLVTYRYDFGRAREDDLIRQYLYPYADGGPVTFTPPGQVLTGEGMAPIGSGWFQATPGFMDYLVENGLPATNPVAAAAKAAPRNEPAADAAPAGQPAAWAWVMIGVAGLAGLALVTPAVRRRVLLLVTHEPLSAGRRRKGRW
jgi:pyruvate/2-oxoglutarate dehydrogenase complex dihydrolipoamide acyltransferase (E2) component